MQKDNASGDWLACTTEVCIAPADKDQDKDEDKFEWYHNWYPMTPVDYLDPAKPHPVTLLGKNLVLWKDESGQWSCLEDICSHRRE